MRTASLPRSYRTTPSPAQTRRTRVVTFNTHGPSRSRQQAAAQSPTTFSRPRGSCLPSCHPRNGSLIYPAGRPAQEFAVPRCNGVVGSLLPSLPPSLSPTHGVEYNMHRPSHACRSRFPPPQAQRCLTFISIAPFRPISSLPFPSHPLPCHALPRQASLASCHDPVAPNPATGDSDTPCGPEITSHHGAVRRYIHHTTPSGRPATPTAC